MQCSCIQPLHRILALIVTFDIAAPPFLGKLFFFRPDAGLCIWVVRSAHFSDSWAFGGIIPDKFCTVLAWDCTESVIVSTYILQYTSDYRNKLVIFWHWIDICYSVFFYVEKQLTSDTERTSVKALT